MKFMIVCMLIAVTLVYRNNGMLSLEKTNELIHLLSAVPDQIDYDKNRDNCTGLEGTSFCSDDPKDCEIVFSCQRGDPYPDRSYCRDGSTCYKGKCSNSTLSDVCEYRHQWFKCVSLDGLYPEPSSCMRYNHCLPNITEPIQSRCEHGWGFNAATASCDYWLNDNYICSDSDRPVPKCLTLGQNGALKGNPALYYVCLPYDIKVPTIFYPFLYKCPRNTKYVGNYVCE